MIKFVQIYFKMFLRGTLADRSVLQKLLFVTGIMLLSGIFSLMLSYLLVRLFYGINLASDTGVLNDFDNPAVLSSMKLTQIISGGIGMFLLPAIIAAYFFDNSSRNYLQIKNLFTIVSFFLVLIIALTSVPFINWMVEINKSMSLPSIFSSLEQWMKNSEAEAAKLTEAFLKINSTGDFIVNLFMIALLPAISEEFFFRGIIQKIFSQMTKNVHAGVILAAILFSAIHLQFYGFFPRMMLGIFLGYLLVWSGSLWLPITAHFINNAAAVVLSYLQQQNKIEFNPDTVGTGTEEKMLLIISVLITSVLIYLIYKIEKKKSFIA